MTAVASQVKPGLDIGKVIGPTFQIYGRNFVPFVLLGLVMSGIPQLLVGFFQVRYATGGAAALQSLGPTGILSFIGVGLVLAVMLMILGVLFQAGIIRSTVAEMKGEKSDLAQNIQKSLSDVPGLLGLLILTGFGIFGAMLLLFVPGIMLAVAWSVSLPARVIEGPGVSKAFGRSLALTRGRRWMIFLLMVLFYIAMGALSSVALGLSGGFLAGQKSPLRLLLFQPLISVVVYPLIPVGLAVLYYQLRASREGPELDNLASVFE